MHASTDHWQSGWSGDVLKPSPRPNPNVTTTATSVTTPACRRLQHDHRPRALGAAAAGARGGWPAVCGHLLAGAQRGDRLHRVGPLHRGGALCRGPGNHRCAGRHAPPASGALPQLGVKSPMAPHMGPPAYRCPCNACLFTHKPQTRRRGLCTATWTLRSWASGAQTCRCDTRSEPTSTRCWTSRGPSRRVE